MRNASGVFVVVLLFLFAKASGAQGSLDGAFQQSLRNLGSDLRLMCLAAHPDDEDGATLACYRKQFGVAAYAVIGTRGEGGQNETGPELYNDLGVLRTREQLAAAEITGAQVSFLNLPEFGYSKTREETFEHWGREETVRRLVRAIRELRPDVIITHHDPETGHGHHQALGAAVLDAFDAAGEPDAFPELAGNGLEPWQASALYVRVWEKPEAPGAVEVDVNQVDSVEGISYAEIAARALEQHKSQGMQFFIDWLRSGEAVAWYVPVKTASAVEAQPGALPPPSGAALFAGIPDRVTPEERALAQASGGRDELKARLLAAAASITADTPLAERRLRRATKAAALALELTLDAAVNDTELVTGQEGSVTVTLTDAGARDCQSAEFTLTSLAWASVQTHLPVAEALDSGKASAVFPLAVPAGQAVTVPHAEHLFDEGFLAPQLEAVARVTCDGQVLTLRAPVHVDIAPPVTVDFPGEPFLAFAGQDTAAPFRLRATNHMPGPFAGRLVLSPSSAFKAATNAEKRVIPLEFATEGEVKEIELPLELFPEIGEREVFVTAMLEGFDYVFHGRGQIVRVTIPEDVAVGVITSYDTTVMDTLARLRVPHEAIAAGEITGERLGLFPVVIVDIRAYHAREDLAANNSVLLDYVWQGGTVLVMYQKTQEWKPEYAPYPIQLSSNRVGAEDAPITLLVPEHPLFSAPNAIAPEDWLGWVQERGLYIPDAWDGHYTPLVRTNDSGEDIPPGSCLICDYGEGVYLYTSLVWYRQLREAHPGALRLFANMLALGK
ncbi:MAG: PIG-L deacetylase family protein [Candidatus Hydrogenedentales bacterium]|jgi:LmbE family N-acetylglucosaminyl deacetylase